MQRKIHATEDQHSRNTRPQRARRTHIPLVTARANRIACDPARCDERGDEKRENKRGTSLAGRKARGTRRRARHVRSRSPSVASRGSAPSRTPADSLRLGFDKFDGTRSDSCVFVRLRRFPSPTYCARRRSASLVLLGEERRIQSTY